MARSKRKRQNKDAVNSEPWKTLVAMLYFLFATWTTAIVMVIVHDRVPDMLVFPPLPGELHNHFQLITNSSLIIHRILIQ